MLNFDLQRLQDLVAAGGPVVVILIGFSVLALTVFFAKLLQFIGSGLYALNAIDEPLAQWRAGQHRAALSAVKALGNKPLPEMVSMAMLSQLNSEVSEHQAREAAARVAADHLDRLRIGMRTLEFIASTAPLMGLLGTVLGMIEAFRALQAAGSQVDPAILSGGISAALLTTAAGLIVAIPAAMLLTILERRMERVHHKLQSATTQVFTVQADLAHAALGQLPPASNTGSASYSAAPENAAA